MATAAIPLVCSREKVTPTLALLIDVLFEIVNHTERAAGGLRENAAAETVYCARLLHPARKRKRRRAAAAA